MPTLWLREPLVCVSARRGQPQSGAGKEQQAGGGARLTDWFDEVLAKYPRIAIAGGPRTGKTTLSNRVTDRRVVHTDDFIPMFKGRQDGWSELSRYVCALVNEHEGPILIEGVRTPHALRKGMIVDAVIWLDKPLETLNRGQASMKQACLTVMDEVRKTMTAAWVFAPPAPLKAAIRSDR